jgi:hypothetical protein
MNVYRSQRWGAALVIFLAGALVGGCSGRKQVTFGLQDADTPTELAATPEESITELPVGTAFEPNQVEVPVAESTLVLQAGYALAALQLDLDGNEPIDALVVSADPQEVRLQAAYPRGLDVTARKIDSFLRLHRTRRGDSTAFGITRGGAHRTCLRNRETDQLLAGHDRGAASCARKDHRPPTK